MKKIICFMFACFLLLTGSIDAYAAGLTDSENSMQKTSELTPDHGKSVTPAEGEEKPLRVLLVGNSFCKYTPENIPYSVEQPLRELAEAEGHNLEITTLAHGQARLAYYAGMDDSYVTYYRQFMKQIVGNTWDYIILQEYSTGPIEAFDTLTFPAVQQLLKMIRDLQPSAKPLLYMTHGFSNGKAIKVNGVSKQLTSQQMELYLAAAYKTLENRLNVEVIPAGMHMNRANYLYPQIKTVGSDLKHPTYAGYYLVACCIYQKIYGKTPNPLKATLTDCTLEKNELTGLAALTADSITMNKQEVWLNVNKTTTLTTTPKRYDLTYKSLDTSVASVNASTGAVTAKKGGYTLIVAETPDGLQALCGVTVNLPPSFPLSYYLAGKGDTIQILPQTTYSNFKWSSDKKTVASVDASTGVVTVNASGRAIITITSNDDTSIKASYTLYVPLDAPKNLTAVSTGNPPEGAALGNIKLTWTSVTGASGYDIYRSTNKNGTYKKIGTSKTKSYIDKTASLNKYYYYKVTAKNSYEPCTSTLSQQIRGIILRAPSLKASVYKKTNIRLTWNKNTRASGYVLYRSTKKNSGYKKITTITSGSKTSFIDKTANTNKTYYYRIKAYRTLNKKTFYGIKSTTIRFRK